MSEPATRVLVANRGEIAVRIIRAAHCLGWETVAIYSDADEGSRWATLADEAVGLGKSQAKDSYLNIDKVLDAARSTGCQFVHPGYGFLSERAEFARRVTEAGLTFVGPTAENIETMGDKAAARSTAERAGVPVVPGSDVLTDSSDAVGVARDLGFPVLVKAAAGGGGRGIRMVTAESDLVGAVEAAQAEAAAAFGDGAVYLEKAILKPRHVEVQVLADAHGNAVHLFERDCSVQRRRQKLIEESPAPGLSPRVREEMLDAAVRLAQEVGYQGAGTAEFLVEEDRFYFIEVNSRIQVEHPVTEMVTGVDLVAEQLRIAAGEPLSVAQEDTTTTGAAIEFRINAEDPDQDFFPSPGQLSRFDPPGGPGVRVDTGFVAGDQIVPYYDSMLAKVIVHGQDRQEALNRARQALTELIVEGITTTRDMHLALLDTPDFREANVYTTWFEESRPAA